jgi:imidazole glycerol phosphate synthase subunit HisF
MVPPKLGANNKMPNISLDEVGINFILRSIDAAGNVNSLALSEDDILTLAQSAQKLRDHILARRSRSGAIAHAMTPVAQIELGVDLHATEILLTMIDRNGARLGFSLPHEVARPLADRLPIRVGEIEAAAKTRTKQ